MLHFVRNVFRYLKTGFDPRNKLRRMPPFHCLAHRSLRELISLSLSLSSLLNGLLRAFFPSLNSTTAYAFKEHFSVGHSSILILSLPHLLLPKRMTTLVSLQKRRMKSFDISRGDQSLPRYLYNGIERDCLLF